MDLRGLIIFMEAAELGSFTRTGEKLGYSQPTISFQIKQLETSLDTQLFERINHTVSLTEKGKEILMYAHHISKLVHDMENIGTADQEIRGHIRIAMADSLCSWLMKENFHIFHKHYPGITIKIIAASTEEMFRLLNQNEVDLVYTLDNHIYDKNYIIESEERLQAHFVTSSHFLDTDRISLNELVRQPFILTEKRMSYRRLMDEKLASMSFEITPFLEIGNTDLICTLIEQNMGLSFLPDYVTEKAVASGKMIRLHIDGFDMDIWKQLLYHRDKWVSPQMQAVMSYLANIKLS